MFNLSIKLEDDSLIRISDLSAHTTFEELRQRIAQQIGGEMNFGLVLGSTEIIDDGQSTLSELGLTSGDRLRFVKKDGSSNQPTSRSNSSQPPAAATVEDMDTSDGTPQMTVIEFRDAVVRMITKTMDQHGFSNISMTAYNKPHLGSQMEYEGRAKISPDWTVAVRIYEDPNIIASVEMSIIKDNARSVRPSFSVSPRNMKEKIVDCLAKNILGLSSLAPSLPHLVGIKTFREVLLEYLPPRDLCRLRGTNRKLHSVLSSQQIDQTFWKDFLKRDFGSEKVTFAIDNQRTFCAVYEECFREQKRIERERQERVQKRHNEDLINPLRVPTRQPPFNPIHPFPHPRPYDPFNPEPDNDIQPFNPFRDGVGGMGEMLPSRPSRQQGPRRLDQFPPNGFSGGNDFI